MAEAVAPPRTPIYRFFCHRCNVEFEDVLQEYTCPYCATGFIERLEHNREGDSFVSALAEVEYGDADMSNVEDASRLEDSSQDDASRTNSGQPMLNDLAFLMTGGRLRPVPLGAAGRRMDSHALMEHLVWMIGAGGGAFAGSRSGGGANGPTAGTPFVLVGAPGDYVFGGEGLDAVVTQLLGQLENTGPPPLPRDQIQAIPSEQITAAQVEANMSCSVCWDNFSLAETVSRLECEHIFHPACISPWLQLHATCPICRRSLLTPEQQAAAAAAATTSSASAEIIITPASSSTTTTQTGGTTPATFSRVVVRRVPSRRRRGTQTPGAASSSSAASNSSAASVARGLWSQLSSHLASAVADSGSASASASASSLGSADRDTMYMDIDYD